MLRDGAENRWIQSRTNLPTSKSSAEIARDIPVGIRARSFFSAKVAESHVLDRFRQISDDYNTGKIGRAEARKMMRLCARESGLDTGSAGLQNLASTARLNLIIDQNAKMARAVGEYERMYHSSNLEAFPYVIYHASVGSKNPRSEHQQYDGMIFDKKDPWLRSHWPPWEFGCNCELENCSAKQAGKEPEKIRPKSPPEVAKNVYSKSGFSFDPANAFSEFDMSVIKSPEIQGHVRESAEIEFGSQVSFKNSPESPKYSMCITAKNFHTFEDENLESSAKWKKDKLSLLPATISVEEGRKQLEQAKEILNPLNEKVIFDKTCLFHWEKEESKSKEEVDKRLGALPMAFETVAHPIEIWDQGEQKGYIKAFKKDTGGFAGCLVFVQKNGKVKTYFFKDINALNKARKGFNVIRF